jgi:hypothetical protein
MYVRHLPGLFARWLPAWLPGHPQIKRQARPSLKLSESVRSFALRRTGVVWLICVRPDRTSALLLRLLLIEGTGAVLLVASRQAVVGYLTPSRPM